jgi:hypothetical protein
MIILSILTALASAQGLGCPADSGTVATITDATFNRTLAVTVDAGSLFAGDTAVVHAAACVSMLPGVAGMSLIRTQEFIKQCNGSHGLVCPTGVGFPLGFPNYQYTTLDSEGKATVLLPHVAIFFPHDYTARAFVIDYTANIATSTAPVRLDPVCPYDPGAHDYCYFCGPCGEGEGDCWGQDSKCDSGLLCSIDSGRTFNFAATVDVCLPETHPAYCSVPLGDSNRCWECGPCSVGEGACAHDLDCLGGALGDTECAFNATLGWNTCQVVTP